MITLYESLLIFICIICILATIRLRVSYRRSQQALIWWNGRQYGKMRYEGEVIRERILQDLFILRRNLELSKVNSRESQLKLEKYDLETFEKLHHSLKQLSEYLYPAHIDDSLGLAVACLVEYWKLQIPGLNLQLDIQTDWHDESYERSRVILMVMSELLQITLPLISPSVSISISLEQQDSRNQLIVKFDSPDISKLESYSCSQQLDFLKHIFTFLIPGKCFYRKQKSMQIWYFYWQASKEIIITKINNDIQALPI
ncbi:MAG: hypothetical protein HC836_41120 [Richelia sp. RM2_1_2]|nr:hypothetical protein [Richelia sp. RM2_1_2]